ncbi:BCCT family transporter [Chitinivibrio alkaliphilus]|uniref:BCCT family transporter n=1 Tax=Chitinivibrio alkaliphilus ACht1 TaxID=1313304 RepID=U7D8F6_9BACT|nr:BCCT family transporter [Chitinivibrio alkaliphilus]ERP30715.1 BCCT family transporter [Chitinivibrio alkaliphilus ACht1]
MSHLTNVQEARKKAKLIAKLDRIEARARRRAIRDRSPFKGLQIQPTASFFDDAEQREPGQDNWTRAGFDLHFGVTLASCVVLALFICCTLLFREEATELFESTLEYITATFGWFLVLTVNIFVLAALFFGFSRFGNIRLGGRDARPEFSTPAWFAMLLSAGMGIGLMFWSVGEPIFHYMSPSPMFHGVSGKTAEAAQQAMGITFFHWGIHPWAIYAVVALGLAFFAFNRGLPLTIRSIFYPLLGERIYGFWGNLIDAFSVLATLIGLATSLGLGVSQINAGMNYLFGMEINTTMQILLIAAITAMATVSVVLGLDGGVKRLSEFNMGLAVLFMLFIIIAGPTVYIFNGFTQNLGFYFSNLVELSFWTETFRDSNWQGGWTIFYWAWWISWSPFVGMFIARVSKGRTVREFLFSVLLIPSLLSFIWMSVFGGSAISLEVSGVADISGAVQDNVATALFYMLDYFPVSGLLSLMGILLVVIFFVTSSDSGSLVVDHLTSGGKLESPVRQRVFWAVMEGCIAAVLLLGGGVTTLQTASVITGLPFAAILLCIIYSLYLGFSQELHVKESVEEAIEGFLEKERLTTLVEEVIDESE